MSHIHRNNERNGSRREGTSSSNSSYVAEDVGQQECATPYGFYTNVGNQQ